MTPARRWPTPGLGLTVYGCEPDEAELFVELAAGRGVVPTLLAAPVSEATAGAVPRNRCVSVGHTSEVTGSVLRALKDAGVDYLSTRSIGTDHIDMEAARALGMKVGNVTYPPDGVADFTVMLILMAIRNAAGLVGTTPGLDPGPTGPRGRDLREMTVGVVGPGRIGRAVIARLGGFGCRVLACGARRPGAAPAPLVPFEELLRESDVITLHLPLEARTRHLIGRPELAAMKRGACLVNTARGALVDTDALIAALESSALGAAALDVLEGEEALVHPAHPGRPVLDRRLLALQQMPNVIVTPHAAYRTTRALRETVEVTLANCLAHERTHTNAETYGRDPVRGLLGGA